MPWGPSQSRFFSWVAYAAVAGLLSTGCGVFGDALVGGSFVSGSFVDVGPDTVPRFFHRASLLPDGRVLVSGGMGLQLLPPGLISLAELSFFDPARRRFLSSFDPLNGDAPVTPRLAFARSRHTQTTLLDGRVLITGGSTGAMETNSGSSVSSVEIFDPTTGKVSMGPDMAVARSDHSATRLPDGRVVVAGGSTWQVFQPDTHSWSSNLPLQRARSAHAAVLLTDGAGGSRHRVLLIGGVGNGPDTLEILDPDGGASALQAATLFVGVDDLAAARLDDGSVLIVGGQDTLTGDTVGLTYLYDPDDDALANVAPVPNRPAGLADHQLVVVDRFAFVFGGEQEVGGVDTELDYMAVFDQDVGDWTFTGRMNHAHDDFASVLLSDGSILLIGGGASLLGLEAPSNSTEVFMLDAAVSLPTKPETGMPCCDPHFSFAVAD